MKPGMCLLEPEEQQALEELVAKEGVFRSAQNLGINYLTLQRVLRRVPIRHETYVTMVTSFRNSEAAPTQDSTTLTDDELKAIRQHVDQLGKAHTSAVLGIARPTLEKILFGATRLRPDTVTHLRKHLAENPPSSEAPPPVTTPATIPIDAEHLEKLRALTMRLSHGQCARRLGVSETTVARALAGSPISQQQHALLIRGLIATPLPEPLPPPPRAACPHCVGYVFEDALARWLTDVRNRRVCRELLAAAQQKRNNIK